MGRQSRNPIVIAGLAGALTLAAPRAAGALALTDAIDDALVSPSIGLVAGLAAGAALTGAGVAIASRARSRARDELPTLEHAPRHLRVPEAERPSGEAAPRHRAPTHAATDYEDIAENYARRLSFSQRMARRAEGVAATLRERMGAGMMDGLPVIERADGSVGDVGTSWWTNAVGADTIIRDSGFAAEGAAIPSDFSATDRDRLSAAARAAARRSSIAERVAYVDEGAYPEHRSVEDLDVADDWEAALRSMDEKIAAVAPQQDPIGFVDAVGGEDSLDEPDNLEPQTAFIPFKAPGGHPEVVDTDSYVDYLIEDEFSKNSSTAARRSSRRFLRMLEGGTQPTSSRHLAGAGAARPVGKHFARPVAAEA
ncbi:hypothetical protein [Thermophilibacter sp.]